MVSVTTQIRMARDYPHPRLRLCLQFRLQSPHRLPALPHPSYSCRPSRYWKLPKSGFFPWWSFNMCRRLISLCISCSSRDREGSYHSLGMFKLSTRSFLIAGYRSSGKPDFAQLRMHASMDMLSFDESRSSMDDGWATVHADRSCVPWCRWATVKRRGCRM